MKDFVEFIAKHLVDKPEEVIVKEIPSENGKSMLLLKVADTDIGKVIGKKGRIIEAIRLLLNAVSYKSGNKIVLEIEEKDRKIIT